MREVKICVGSSCHIKGSHSVIEKLSALIVKNNLSGSVLLKASFCMGSCTDGVCVTVDGVKFTGITDEGTEAFFEKEIRPIE